MASKSARRSSWTTSLSALIVAPTVLRRRSLSGFNHWTLLRFSFVIARGGGGFFFRREVIRRRMTSAWRTQVERRGADVGSGVTGDVKSVATPPTPIDGVVRTNPITAYQSSFSKSFVPHAWMAR